MLLFMGLGGQELLLILLTLFVVLLVSIIPVIPLWTIFKKSGQNPLLSLLALLPGIGLLLALYIAAFSTWRTDRQASQ